MIPTTIGPKLALLLALALTGCATGQPRHTRPHDSPDRQVAWAGYTFGGLAGFGGCVAGFAGAGPIAFPICIGGWAMGMSSMGYLMLDDELRTRSYWNSTDVGARHRIRTLERINDDQDISERKRRKANKEIKRLRTLLQDRALDRMTGGD